MTPSDSQDGARRRDDAVPEAEGSIEGRQFGAVVEAFEARDAVARSNLTARIARLEAERDEARAAQLRLLRELTATCSCGTSPMTYEGPEPDCAVHGAVRAFNEAAAELARMRPVYDAAVAWRAGLDHVGAARRHLALLAAVDQTAPSSPLETQYTADVGEAGVVEGAGGSEAAEGVVVVRDQPSDLERQEMDDIRRWFMVVRPGSQPFEVGDQVDVYEVPVPEPTGRDIRAALVLYAEDTDG